MKQSQWTRKMLGLLAATFLIAMLLPGTSLALTTADATIFNQATVNYTFQGATSTQSANVSVDVTTLGVAPTVTVTPTSPPATPTQYILENQEVVYTYTVRSNANGEDVYTIGETTTNTGFSTNPTNTLSAASVTLWGGYAIAVSGVNTLTFPGGSLADLAGTETLELLVNGTQQQYSINTINAGAPDTGTGETLASLVLTPIGTSEQIDLGDVAAGTQIGEYTTVTMTHNDALDAILSAASGTIETDLTFTTTALTAGGVTDSASAPTVHTVVTAAQVSITKESRNVTSGSAFVDNTAITPTSARPGEVIEYRITVTNNHPTLAVTDIYVDDAIPTYTTQLNGQYNGGTHDVQIDFVDDSAGPATTTSYGTSANDGDQAELNGGSLRVTAGSGAGDADSVTPVGGTLDAGDSAVILFQVTVQ